MSLDSGCHLGGNEITAQLCEGGMGEARSPDC